MKSMKYLSEEDYQEFKDELLRLCSEYDIEFSERRQTKQVSNYWGNSTENIQNISIKVGLYGLS